MRKTSLHDWIFKREWKFQASHPLRNLFVANRESRICKVRISLRVWSFYSHALHILSADNSGRFLQNPREVAQIVGGQNAQSMRVIRSDLQKDYNFTFCWERLAISYLFLKTPCCSRKLSICISESQRTGGRDSNAHGGRVSNALNGGRDSVCCLHWALQCPKVSAILK